MSARDTPLQKPDSNRHITPYEGAAFLSDHSAKIIRDDFPRQSPNEYASIFVWLVASRELRAQESNLLSSAYETETGNSVPPTRKARTGNRTRIICLEGRCAGRYTTRTKASNGTRTRKSALAERCVAITRYLHIRASRRIRTDSLLITKQLRFRCAREA